MLKLCMEEAEKNNLKPEDYWGGFVLDEMTIQVRDTLLFLKKEVNNVPEITCDINIFELNFCQEDIELVIKDGKHHLSGFVDLGKTHSDMEALSGEQFSIMQVTIKSSVSEVNSKVHSCPKSHLHVLESNRKSYSLKKKNSSCQSVMRDCPILTASFSSAKY